MMEALKYAIELKLNSRLNGLFAFSSSKFVTGKSNNP